MKRVLVIALLLSLNACSVVGPGERGLRVSFGKVSQDVLEPGAYVWIPFFLGMQKIDVQIQKSEIESSAASKDMQEITSHVAVNWSINPEALVNTYKNVGDEGEVYARIITPAVNEVMKSAAAKFTAEEVLTKRMEMKLAIDDGLKNRLATYGVKLYDVNIVNLKFSSEFAKAIEAKQVAEQEAQQEVYVAQKAKQEAFAQIERAKGEAEAQRLVKATITAEILKQRAIEKWDGKFPQFMGSGAMPFLNVSDLK